MNYFRDIEFDMVVDLPNQPAQQWNIPNLAKSYIPDYSNNPNFNPNSIDHHFIRRVTREVVEFLRTSYAEFINLPTAKGLLLVKVEGSAGVGKSTETFGWWQTLNVNKIFIHSHHSTDKHPSPENFGVVCFFAKNNTYRTGDFENFNDIEDLLDEYTVIVLDGSFSDRFVEEVVRSALRNHQFVVLCATGQSAMIQSFQQKYLIIRKKVVDGFTLDDYIAGNAIMNNPPLDPDQINARYFYCGGSARLFGYIDMNTLKEHIDSHVSSISSDQLFFSTKEHNTLKTYRRGEAILVSNNS